MHVDAFFSFKTHLHLNSVCHKCLDTQLSICSGSAYLYVEECISVNIPYKPTVLSVPLLLTQALCLLNFKELLLLHMTNGKQPSKHDLEIIT